jgi:KDO2-lipid IV(A) lauroyltransferase
MFRFFLYKISQFIVNILPIRGAYAFAQVLSDLQYAFSLTDRRSVRSNIRKILNSEHVDEKLVRDVFRNFGRYLVDFFRMVRYVNEGFVNKNVKCEGVDNVRDVLKRGKGAIIVSAHIGNWELGAIVMKKLGFPVLAVALPHKHKLVTSLFNAQRELNGVTVVAPSVAVRRCLEKLKANESIALVADRDFGTHGLVMDFLGYKTLLPKGPAILAIKTGAGIVPTFLVRNPDGTFTMTFDKPVYAAYVDDQTISDSILMDVINQYIKVVEAKIRQFPSQWLMFREFAIIDHPLTNQNDKFPKSVADTAGRFVIRKGKVNK